MLRVSINLVALILRVNFLKVVELTVVPVVATLRTVKSDEGTPSLIRLRRFLVVAYADSLNGSA